MDGIHRTYMGWLYGQLPGKWELFILILSKGKKNPELNLYLLSFVQKAEIFYFSNYILNWP